MSPGSISQLIESDDEALRVRFDGPLPPPPQRYWRGPVMHDFDGYTWRQRRGQSARQPALKYLGQPYHYEITLEPASHNVLIALELPRGTPEAVPFSFYTYDYQLVTPRPLDRTLSYSLQSFPEHTNADSLSALGRTIDLQLPRGRNPRSVALAAQLRAAAPDDAAFVDRVLDYFRKGGFEYTLTPPRLDLNSIDDFLFNTRLGFCGHYASAFVMLMRAGGVPARVVTGYLGGEWNRFGKYLLLRQSHAHAWAEVWLQGRGWTRVDPTAVVAPERLTRDVYAFLRGNASANRGLYTASWIGPARQMWEAMNAWWQDEFLGFNFFKQMNLLGSLGLAGDDWHALAWLLAAGFALWALSSGLSLRPRLPRRRDELSRSWQALERKLRAIGFVRAAHEGPVAFAARVQRSRPDLAAVGGLARTYAQLRYGPVGGAQLLARLRRGVRALLRQPGGR